MASGIQQIFEESVSAVTATPSITLGTERWENGRKYRYMFNKSTSTCSTKLGVVYSASSGFSVTASSVLGQYCAGVVYNADIPTLNYGWVVVNGHVPVTSSGNSAIVMGHPIILDASGAFTIASGGTAGTGHIVGGATGDTATAGTFAAFINVG